MKIDNPGQNSDKLACLVVFRHSLIFDSVFALKVVANSWNRVNGHINPKELKKRMNKRSQRERFD